MRNRLGILVSLLPGMRKHIALVFSAFLILGVGSEAKANTVQRDCYSKSVYVSWYGHAKRIYTANGGVYNHKLYFAASKTLPFGIFTPPTVGSITTSFILQLPRLFLLVRCFL